MKFSNPPIPTGRPTVYIEPTPSQALILPSFGGSLNIPEPEHLTASVRELGVIGMNGSIIRAYGNLPPESMTAIRDSAHPLTDFAVSFTSGEYAGCEWKIGKGNPIKPEPVNAPWTQDILRSLSNVEESMYHLKKRMLYVFRTVGIFALGLYDDPNKPMGVALKMYPFEDVQLDEAHSYNMTDVAHSLRVDLRNPFLDGRKYDYYPVFRNQMTGGMSSSLYEIRNTDMRTGRLVSTPVIRNAPLYELWWALVRGDLGTAESIATQNGILWFNTEEEDELQYTHEQAGLPSASLDHQSVYNAMNQTFDNGQARDGYGKMADDWITYTKRTWDHPKRHLSRSPLPMWGAKAPEWIQIGRPYNEETERKLQKTELRIAQGLDLPAEWILGSVDTSRQNLQNDKATTSRLQAAIRQAGHELDQIVSRSILWSLMRAMGRSDYQDYFIYTDWTRMTTQPDRSEDWKWAHENLGVKRELVAAGLGFPEDTLLQEDERKEWLTERLVLGGHGSDAVTGPKADKATDKATDKQVESNKQPLPDMLKNQESIDKQAAAKQPNHRDGVMVSIRAPREYAVKGGLDPNDLHITLLYLGKTADVDRETAVQALNDLDVASSFPMRIKATELGRFQGVEQGTKDVWFLKPQADHLVDLHHSVTDALKAVGIESASSYAEYKPHMTLGYVEPGMALEEDSAGGVFDVDGFELVYGEEVIKFNQTEARINAALDDNEVERIEMAINAAAESETNWLNAVLSAAYDTEIRQIASRVAAKADRSVHESIRAAKEADNYSAILFDERILAASSFDVEKELDKAFESLHDKLVSRFEKLPNRIAASVAKASRGKLSKEDLVEQIQRHSRPEEAANRVVAAMQTKLRDAVNRVRNRIDKVESSGKVLDNELLTASVDLGEAAESTVMPIVHEGLAAALGGSTLKVGASATSSPIPGILSTRPFDDIAADLELKVEYTWLYGDEERKEFEPHKRLDERSFASWDDDVLLTPPEAAWIRKTHLHPGDHNGCACSYKFKLGRITTTVRGNPFEAAGNG